MLQGNVFWIRSHVHGALFSCKIDLTSKHTSEKGLTSGYWMSCKNQRKWMSM